MSGEQQEYSEQLFAGVQFAQAREALGLSVEQVSQELNLSAKILRAIESGTPQSLPNPVFVRGYIRNYAKRVGLDPDLFARQFEAIPGVNLTPTTVRSAVSLKAREPHKTPFMRVFTWLLLIAVLAVAAWWAVEEYELMDQFGQSVETPGQTDAVVVIDHDASSPAASGQVATVAPASTERQRDSEPDSVAEAVGAGDTLSQTGSDDASVPAAESAEAEAPLVTSGDSQAVVSSVSTSAVTSEQPPVPAEQPPAVADAVSSEAQPTSASGLSIRFIDDCWVQIRDAEGASLFAGVARAGSDLNLQGEEPLSVVIGRVDAVSEISYMGEVINLAGMSSRNVARFNLPLR